jgi:hypothetical protein
MPLQEFYLMMEHAMELETHTAATSCQSLETTVCGKFAFASTKNLKNHMKSCYDSKCCVRF